ncbi:hypothetical protein ABBQ32_011616 [Trebouxia sp. C0010 RCD-2024]
MATEEWVKRAIENSKTYEDLPPKVRTVLPVAEWKAKVKEHCIQCGFGWTESLANTSCSEPEYYEDLLRFYRYNYRLFPYHLSDYVCRVLRVTPFKYYCDLLYTVMREEKSYDQIPNFAAADIVQLVGIGRNEYIAIMNKCKAKKLLWRVNKSIAKEYLPVTPLDLNMQPWWTVAVVNLSEQEHRALSPEELKVCQDCCKPGAKVADLDRQLLQQLHKKGLIHLDVPIRPEDHVSIPPLEGFVSNKDSDEEGKGDPLEALLYAVFVASSERASVAELAGILSVKVPKLQMAISIACRLGFGTRLPPAGEGEAKRVQSGEVGSELDLGDGTSTPASTAAHKATKDGEPALAIAGLSVGEAGQATALVVDAEVTSILMMGALSPGLKRHSVTLFEGGRVTGREVIAELVEELRGSVAAAERFEGEMRNLAAYAKALAQALDCIRTAGGNRPVEVLRKESLAGLAPSAACRVLSHAYAAVVPITPLPYPPLPLSPNTPGPTNFGPTAEAGTPWLQLALYTAMAEGPLTVVLVCGQRLWRLPPQLACCTHALVWPWDLESVRAQSSPVMLDAAFLLFSLNEYLSRTAIMVQPLNLPEGTEVGGLTAVQIPLPPLSKETSLQGIDTRTGSTVSVERPANFDAAMKKLGLQHALGSLRLVKFDLACATASNENIDVANMPRQAQQAEGQRGVSQEEQSADESAWVPLHLQLGLPLVPAELCDLVCSQATAAKFLDTDCRRQHQDGQAQLQQQLFSIISDYGACSNCQAVSGSKEDEAVSFVDLPIYNLLFDGKQMHQLDYSDYQQGIGCLCIE